MTRNAMLWACLLLNAMLPSVPALGYVAYDEEVSGDLSGDYAHPTILNLLPGSNVVAGAAGVFDEGEDIEYVNVNLPTGYQLSELRLLLYEGRDLTAFVGVQEGTAFTFPADEAFSHITDMIGWSHIGPGAGTGVGSDLLPPVGQNGQGFVPPLNGAAYTFWIQQTGSVMDYQFDFVVSAVPEPAAGSFIGMALLSGVSWRRRSRSFR